MRIGRFSRFILAVTAITAVGHAAERPASESRFRTYANPMDLAYRFQPPNSMPPSRPAVPFREAADPTVVVYRGEYWLFASHSLGYWRSKNLLNWTFVRGSGYSVEKFAPTVVVVGGRMLMAVSEGVPKLWTTDDPGSGKWTEATTLSAGYEDPDLFLDDDGRLYLYDGLSPNGPLKVTELDPHDFHVLRTATIPQARNKEERGWEVPGDQNEKTGAPSFIEGSWMTKHDGRYYLEYSGPGTQFKTYANGLLVAKTPMGPFEYQSYSPFALKSTGFITGAGHGSTFKGLDGQWWHVGTMTISSRHIFERRLGLFPTHFTRKGEMVADTYLGDYPHYLDGDRRLTGWMLLSRGKVATASSSLDGHAPGSGADEDVRSWWSARTGDTGEWFAIDLGGSKTVEALQVNFADQDAVALGASEDVFRYAIEGSADGQRWQTLVEPASTGRDAPHAYHVLRQPREMRYVRVRNLHSPNGAKFSLYDLRVFGNARVAAAGAVAGGTGQRDVTDRRRAEISWKSAPGADFYVVRVGVSPNLMTQTYQVYDGATSLSLAALNVRADYVFSIDAVNESGITRGTTVYTVR